MAPKRARAALANPHSSTGAANLETLSQQLCPLAQRVPAIPKGLGTVENSNSKTNRTALVKVVDTLFKIPHLRQAAWSWVEEEVDKLKKNPTMKVKNENLWPESCTSIGKIKPQWAAQWLRANFGSVFTEALLEKISNSHRDNITQVFQLMCGMFDKDALPEDMQDNPELFGRFALDRAKNAVRMDYKLFVTKCIDAATGAVSFDTVPFAYEWGGDGKLKTLTSYLGDKYTLAPHEVITKEFKVKHANDVKLATAQLRNTKYCLHAFFPPEALISQMLVDKKGAKIKEAAQKAQEQHNKALEAAKQHELTQGTIALGGGLSDEQKKRKAEEIRKKAADQKEKRVRTVDLSKTTPEKS